MAFTVQTPAQLAAYLRSLRKAEGLTQGALGKRLGVSAARISTIEQNPSAVSLGQLLRILHALGAQIQLNVSAGAEESAERQQRSVRAGEW